MLWEINILFFYFFICFLITLLLFTLSVYVKRYFFNKHVIYIDNFDKNQAFECGFNPFSDTRTRFEVRFYLVAILFIIFDLEIVFLFPWVMVLRYIGFFGFWIMFVFLFVLIVGFIYEWLSGALDWY